MPPEPEEDAFAETPTPAWAGPADDELGVEIPLHLVVGESETALIALQSVTTYQHGLVFNLAARAKREPTRRDPFDEDDPFDHFADRSPRSPTFVRFGLQFSDGSKVTNLMSLPVWWDGGVSTPERPVLIGHPEMGGYGNGGAVDASYWLWPLPPGDDLRVVVEWPAEGITETSTEVKTTALLDAATTDTRF